MFLQFINLGFSYFSACSGDSRKSNFSSPVFISEKHLASHTDLKAAACQSDFFQDQIKALIHFHPKFHSRILVIQYSLFLAKVLQFLYRILKDFSIFQFQFSRNCQAVLPAFFNGLVDIFFICIRHSIHPIRIRLPCTSVKVCGA